MTRPHRSVRFAHRAVCLAVCLAACALAACSEAKEAERVELPVVTDGAGLGVVTSDLGYEVELSSASLAADGLKFTIAGEAHVSLWQRLSDIVVPVARAHPGHFQGGEVTGELPGHFVLRFVPGEVHELGVATLLAGTYHAVNLGLSYASSDDVDAGDPLAGHTAVLSGTATKDGAQVEFQVVIDSPEGRELVGIPFEEEIASSTQQTLALRFNPLDPLEMDTLFDGVDFAALDADADGRVELDPRAADEATAAAYNLIRRVFQTHDHFVVQSRH